MTNKTTQRDYLLSQGFKVGARGRFSSEMITALKNSGLEFTKPIKEPKARTKRASILPLA